MGDSWDMFGNMMIWCGGMLVFAAGYLLMLMNILPPIPFFGEALVIWGMGGWIVAMIFPYPFAKEETLEEKIARAEKYQKEAQEKD